jgi:hypothetical protein
MGYQIWQPPSFSRTGDDYDDEEETILCAPFAASGFGMLTSTGLSRRGHKAQDYQTSRNVGRGGSFWKFRNHILSKMFAHQNINEYKEKPDSKFRIQMAVGYNQTVFTSILQARFKGGDVDLLPQTELQIIEDVNSFVLDPDGMIYTATKSQFWIALSDNDNSTWPAIFMPQGSSLVLLYDETNIIKRMNKAKDSQSGEPIRKDFDVWNHMSHLKVHWLSLRHGPEELADIIFQIVQHEKVFLAPKYLDNVHDIKEKDLTQLGGGLSDRTFNGLRVRPTHFPLRASNVHCVGDNWQWDAKNYRSCHFQPLCFDTATQDFVMAPAEDASSFRVLHDTLFFSDSVSTDPFDKKVMMGESIRIGNGKPWFPRQTASPRSVGSVYELGEDVIWLSFVPEQINTNNPGHLLWDFWLPLFNLLQMFGHDRRQILLTYSINESSCLKPADKSPGICLGKMVLKYLQLLGVNPSTFSSSRDFRFSSTKDLKYELNSTALVCARNGLAGIGMLTDHGFKKHGQVFEDYRIVRNVGRGPFFWDFRGFVLGRMNLTNEPLHPNHFKLTFSINSSNNPSRRLDFARQISMTKERFPDHRINVEMIDLSKMPLKQQLRVMGETNIFVSVIGGSASTAMFMQRNSCLILFYNDKDDFVKGSPNERMPNMMDWDFWNNASYL